MDNPEMQTTLRTRHRRKTKKTPHTLQKKINNIHPLQKKPTQLAKFGIQINTKQVRGYIVFTIGYSALW